MFMSTDISHRQFVLLRKFQNGHPIISSFSKSDMDDCSYLVKSGFLVPVKEYVHSDFAIGGARPVPTVVSYSTTAAGRAAMYDFRAAFHKWWISVVISSAAFMVSLLAFLFK